MLLLPHAIIGATIAAKIGNPWLALPLAFISHFAADMIPHWNPHISQEMREHNHLLSKTRKFIFFDTVISLIVGSIIALGFFPNLGKVAIVYLGCFMGVLPDLFESPYFFWGIKNKYLMAIMRFQKKMQTNVELPWGIITQIVIVAICFWFLFF